MGLYAYSVRDRSGKLFCGELEAETLKAAAFRLKAEGFYITSLVPVRSGRLSTLRFPWGWGNKGNARALAVFCREMAVL
ncbi:MAG: type II secretion system F family protein, partial [Bacillota bacterium]|nr:type II secretion system F family protein [Bacillota bacterium]